MNKKILFSGLLGFLLFAGSQVLATAGDTAQQVYTFISTGVISFGTTSLSDVVGGIIANGLWIIFTAIIVICFLISGISFLTAQGDAEKLKTARSSFIWGVVGVVVGILAFSIYTIIKNLVGA